MRHEYNENLICKCGRTFEWHKRAELLDEKWRMNNFEGKVDVKKMFEEFDALEAEPKVLLTNLITK
jgi:hypothetical protein